jgi:hypothetical protein
MSCSHCTLLLYVFSHEASGCDHGLQGFGMSSGPDCGGITCEQEPAAKAIGNPSLRRDNDGPTIVVHALADA